MQIRCNICQQMNAIKNRQLILHKMYICSNCKSVNLLYGHISVRILKIIYIIIFGILPISFTIEYLWPLHIIFKSLLSLGVASLCLLIFFPLYKYLFLKIYNRNAKRTEQQ